VIDGKVVGCGITTFNRPEQLQRLCKTLPMDIIDYLVIVNDGEPYALSVPGYAHHFLQNECNLGVAKSKNKALDYLLACGADHIFLIEDDIFVRDPEVFSRYVQVAGLTGIQHMNFSQHGMMNKTPDGRPNPRVTIEYSQALNVPFYPHCVGAFSYYSKQCLLDVGGMDEGFYNAFEHVEHTLRVIQAGQHPCFWYFADIPDSAAYLGDDAWSVEQSTISSRHDHQMIAQRAAAYFQEKHGVPPVGIPLASSDEFVASVRDIHGRYAVKSSPEDSSAERRPGMALAHKYCVGQGIELGAAAHNAFYLPSCLNVAPSDGVDYVHPRDLADFLKYSNAQVERVGDAVSVDLVGDYQTIRSEDGAFDYIVSSHVIEHTPNVFAAYIESQRVLKDLGVFFCIFPKRVAAVTDGVRALTTLPAMIEAFELGVGIESMPEEPWREHYQVFSLQRMLEAVNYLNCNGLGCWYVECVEETDSKVGNGHTVVLRKVTGLAASRITDNNVFVSELEGHLQAGCLREALTMIKVSLSFEFFDPAKLHLAAFLSRELGDVTEAVEFLRQALIVEPENEDFRKVFFEWTGGFYTNPVL
jgi:SAM-dependent methyltransferase